MFLCHVLHVLKYIPISISQHNTVPLIHVQNFNYTYVFGPEEPSDQVFCPLVTIIYGVADLFPCVIKPRLAVKCNLQSLWQVWHYHCILHFVLSINKWVVTLVRLVNFKLWKQLQIKTLIANWIANCTFERWVFK